MKALLQRHHYSIKPYAFFEHFRPVKHSSGNPNQIPYFDLGLALGLLAANTKLHVAKRSVLVPCELP